MAELIAVHRSTDIANITTGIPLSRIAAAAMRVAGPMVGRILARTVAHASRLAGPAESTSAVDALRSRIWALATDDDGRQAVAILETGEGYAAAAQLAVRAVETYLCDLRVGALTPIQALRRGLRPPRAWHTH